MKKVEQRLILDTNIWSEIAKLDAGVDLGKVTRLSSVRILVTPTIVEEIRAIPEASRRQKALKLVTQPGWVIPPQKERV
jgi:hypothetical protein